MCVRLQIRTCDLKFVCDLMVFLAKIARKVQAAPPVEMQDHLHRQQVAPLVLLEHLKLKEFKV